jgi:hypothetical protein
MYNAEPYVDFPAAFYLHDIDALSGGKETEKFVKLRSEFVKKVSPQTQLWSFLNQIKNNDIVILPLISRQTKAALK